VLRIFLLAYFVVTTTAFFQLTLNRNSPLFIVAIVVISFFCLGLLVLIGVRLVSAGYQKAFERKTLRIRFGALYTHYQVKHYRFFIPYVASQFVMSVFFGFLYTYPWVQLIGVLSTEAVMLILLMFIGPFEYRFTSAMNIFTAVIRTVSAALQILLHPTLGFGPVPQLAIGVVQMVLQALVFLCFALILVVNMLRAGCNSCTSKKVPDNDPQVPSGRQGYDPHGALPTTTNNLHSRETGQEFPGDSLDRKFAQHRRTTIANQAPGAPSASRPVSAGFSPQAPVAAHPTFRPKSADDIHLAEPLQPHPAHPDADQELEGLFEPADEDGNSSADEHEEEIMSEEERTQRQRLAAIDF
jgi:hypothetical protein